MIIPSADGPAKVRKRCGVRLSPAHYRQLQNRGIRRTAAAEAEGNTGMHETLKVTAVLEDYLEAILNLNRFGNGARSRDIAEALSVHKSTVTSALKALNQMGLVFYSPYEAVTLTPKGKQLAQDVAKRHETLKSFFTDVLDVDPATAETAACGMEHSMPREIVDKLARFAEHIREDRNKSMM